MKFMRICQSLIALCAFVVSWPAYAQDTQVFLEGFRVKHGFASVSAAASLNGQLVFSGASGMADIEGSHKAQVHTRYRIGSVSKVITAIGIMQMVEQGKLDLDTPISVYAPKLPVALRNITIRQLLSHSSGIQHYGFGHPWSRDEEYDDVWKAVRLFQHEPLEFAPGTGQRYTTYGFTLLHALAEKASGVPLEEFLAENVWRRAGMIDTRFDRAEAGDIQRAAGYRPWALGRMGRLSRTDDNVSFKYAGGGMLSTPTDLVELCGAFLGGIFVSDVTRDEMIRKQAGNFGLGWEIVTGENGSIYRIYHSGESLGYRAIINCYPKQAYAFAMTINTWNGASNVFREPIEFFAEKYAGIASRPGFW